jgi:hypothetical protein
MTSERALPTAVADPLRAERRSAALRAGAVALLAAAAFAATHLVTLPGLPMCAFKLWTGFPCPGCGMTRSVFHLAHGDLAGSFRFHPLGLAATALVAAVFVGGLHGAVTGRDPVWRFLDRRGTWVGLGIVAALVLVWVVRTFVVPDWASDPIGPGIFAAR